MIPLRILIEFKSPASFACRAFKLVGASVESLFLFCVCATIFILNASVQNENKCGRKGRSTRVEEIPLAQKNTADGEESEAFIPFSRIFLSDSGIPKGLVLGRGQGAAPLAGFGTESQQKSRPPAPLAEHETASRSQNFRYWAILAVVDNSE
ncbi:hypothetical protein SAMN02745702_00475 [Desulfobaculum bizertense DSM 18034]|uniref:Uncharacterized protein n=1 Tax=Desulfobaculum bizertense DSM 18034 TaxID=1121442 RepID=A0A1T4VJN0_9BACT|nr:hypothetical protein SAMN02745702_00475 [Desulfobaculum bizertense DSM 18034]